MQSTQNTRFTSGSIPKAMFAFVGPYILSVLVQNLYGAVDLLVVGQFATTADVSAVTIGSQLMSMATQLVIGFATGTTVLIGQHFGAANEKALGKTAGSSFTVFGIMAVVVTAVFFIMNKPFVSTMQTPQEAIEQTQSYVFICTLGLIFVIGYNVISSILIGKGDTKTPFLFILIACIINVALDVVLVKGFGMGATGAAIATTLAQAGSLIFSGIYLMRKGMGFAFSRRDFIPHKKTVISILKIGGPVAIQNSLIGVSFLFITAIINAMGVTASASAGVVEKLINFLFIPSIAFGAAVSTMSSQNIGAGKPERARTSMYWGIGMALVPSVLITVFCQFGGVYLTSIFSTDEGVILMAADYLKSYVVDIVLVSFIFCMNGYFNSIGKSWFTLLHSLLTTFACRIPLSLLFSKIGERLYEIGWAAPISTLVSLVLCVVFFMYLQKKEQSSKPISIE